MKLPVEVDESIVTTTLQRLVVAGRRGAEGIVLWLGRASSKSLQITEVFEPIFESSMDFFRIPPAGMQQLMTYLRRSRLRVVAQVHSHPAHAFHSEADDVWAIVRHEGALSIVVPYFARKTRPEDFLRDAKTFRLMANNEWEEVNAAELNTVLALVRK